MRRMVLPPRPDFTGMAQAAAQKCPERQALLAQIGELNFRWSNTESLFIYVVMLLLETDEASAAIVFATLNTTRSRLDLIHRLAKIKLTDPHMQNEIDDIIEGFGAATRIRNEFNHTTFVFGPDGSITHTQSTRLEEKRGRLSFGALSPMDAGRKATITKTIEHLNALNQALWDILPRLKDEIIAHAAQTE